MDLTDEEALIAFLQAQLVAITALYQSHPQPALLLSQLQQCEAKVVPKPVHEAYQQTLDDLRVHIAAG